jgi:predicted RND superfamily exporter protein
MTAITLIFIPNKTCVIWVIFTIISVEVGVVGLMSIININLDVISMIMLIVSIGFSVDFSAHISYHYLSGISPPPPRPRSSVIFLLHTVYLDCS